jgi:RuvB-like protein 1 (pontin 52)
MFVCDACLTLRYAIQLLTPASILARTNARQAITREDAEEAHKLFYDAKESARMLQRHSK